MRTILSHILLQFSLVLIFLSPSFAAYDSASSASEKELRITRITPEGNDIEPARQIVISFNRPVVPIGKMDRQASELPITISPELTCEWRWLNTTSLACQLAEKNALKEATHYHVTVSPGIKAQDGTTIAAPYVHDFITRRPDVNYTNWSAWEAPGKPVLRLILNQEVTKGSLEKHVFFNAQGKRIKAVITPEPKIHQEPEHPEVVAAPGESYFILFRKFFQHKTDANVMDVRGEEARKRWQVRPAEELPAETEVVLQVEPGLVSALGPEQGIGNHDITQFTTFPQFTFIGISCQNNAGEKILVTAAKSQGANELCNPMATISLAFSSPVLRSEVKRHITVTPDLAHGRKDLDVWGDYDYSRITYPYKENYLVNLPFGLKAAEQYHIMTAERPFIMKRWWNALLSLFKENQTIELRDEFNRPLTEAIDIRFKTNHRKPNLIVDHHTVILEKNTDSEVPVYVNNLTILNYRHQYLTQKGAKISQSYINLLPTVPDVQYAMKLGVRDILKGNSGVVYGHMEMQPLVKADYPNAFRLFAEVTPYQLHMKLGHFSSLLWVTDLQTGKPVPNARVTVYKAQLAALTKPGKLQASAVTDSEGIAMLPGTEALDPELVFSQYERDTRRLLVRVDTDTDMALLPLSYDFSINTWRVSNSVSTNNQKKDGHMIAWGTTAQGIYHTGDTIQYKLYVRNQDDRTLVPATPSEYSLTITDPTGKEVETVEHITLSEFGAYHGEFTVAEKGAVGWYQFTLTRNDLKTTSWTPMRVLVSDFTPSPFKVTNELKGDLVKTGDEVEVLTSAKLHSGGAYGNASARVTATLESKTFTSAHPLAKEFYFNSYSGHEQTGEIYQKIDKLNDKGEMQQHFTLPEQHIYYGSLRVESAVRDDRGKNVAGESRVDYVGLDRFVGLHSSEWLFKANTPSEIAYVVVNERGVPMAGTKVTVAIERQVTNAARVKGAGNAYIANYTTSWKEESRCEDSSTEAPLSCKFTAPEAGSYRAVATISDSKGRAHRTELELWVTGKNYVLWEDKEESKLQIIPEKTEYHVGDTARYLVRNPYPGAMALITVERYGVIDHFTKMLDSSMPVIEIPVKPDYLPGFYLSVMVVSPRVDKPLEKGQVDLGKPTYRMGYVSVPVKDKYKEMVVSATADKAVYRPHDKVKIRFHATPRVTDKAEPIELAVAVLDESVFALLGAGKGYFDPYQGFYDLEGLDVQNYSLITRLLGRQKFEKKGANPGGDGGKGLGMRNIFKYVSYWNPSLVTDAKGDATAEFTVPDNLTGWRILVLATTPTDRMGLGEGSFKVNQPTEIRPAMPNQVTESDQFQAAFTVMNRTDTTRSLQVTVQAKGDITGNQPATYNETVTLAPYKRAIVKMPVSAARVDDEEEKGEIVFTASARDSSDGDRVQHLLPVIKKRSLETSASYGTTLAAKVEEPVVFPLKIHTDRGGVSVVVSPSIISNLDGAFRYMRDYPYSCWEQTLTKGVMAAHYTSLKAYMPQDFIWKESEKLQETTLSRAASFQAPSGGMAYFTADDSHVDPYLSAYTALGFNWLRRSNHPIPEQVETKLAEYLQGYLRNNVAPDFYSEGMTATSRAVALAALAERGEITGEDILRYKPHMTRMSLFGKAHYLQAVLSVGGNEALAAEVAKNILSYANQTGGKFVFSEQLDDGYSRILASPLRDNCAVLDAFVAYGETEAGQSLVGDVAFKLVRTISETRKNRDHWENTQENMFCMNALASYSRVYEKETPSMAVTSAMDGTKFGETAFNDLTQPPVTFERRLQSGDSGRKSSVVIEKQGEGRLYYAARLTVSAEDDALHSVSNGIEIRREYSVERGGAWVLLKEPLAIRKGELVRSDMYLSVPAARNFVAVNDPVPGGLEPVNRDLATTSSVDAAKGEFKAAGGSWWFKFSDWSEYNVSRWNFYHQELRHDSVRYYADYLPAGNYHLSYTAQAIAEGDFALMPVQAEEMYNPDVFGKGAMEHLHVTGE